MVRHLTRYGAAFALIVAVAFPHTGWAAYYTPTAAPLPVQSFGVIGDGVTDDTAAMQAALSSGASLMCAGLVVKTTATLNITSLAQQGTALAGSGPLGSDATANAARCVIQPSAAVTTAVLIDGAGRSAYENGVKISDLTLDMTNMAAGSKGFKQGQTFDISYKNVRVIGGTGKYSWYMAPGAYVTHLDTVQGSTVACIGTGVNNPTTLLISNPDINAITASQCANVTVTGGAVQSGFTNGATTVNWLASGNTNMLGFYDTVAAFNAAAGTTGGIYLAVGSSFDTMQNLLSSGTDFEVLGTPGTGCTIGSGTWAAGSYNDGTHGCHPVVWIASVSGTVRGCAFDVPVFGGMYLQENIGSNACTVRGYTLGSLNRSQNLTNVLDIHNASTWINNGQALYGYSDNGVTQSFLIDASTGGINYTGGSIRPLADGTNNLLFYNAAGAALGGVFTSATAANSTFFFNHFTASDGTHTASMDQNGLVTGNQVKAQPTTDSTTTFVGLNVAGTQLVNFTPNVVPASSQWAFANGIQVLGYSDNFTTVKFSMSANTGAILSKGTGGLGYSTGAGAAVTQITSRATGVTINNPTGAITLFTAAGSATYATFTVTDSAVAATDTIVVNEKSGTNLYIPLVTAVGAGSFNISFATTGGTASDAPVFNFAVIKGSAS